MRLYTLTDAASVGNDDYGDFEVAQDGSVQVPEPFGQFLLAQHTNGEAQWEDDAQRNARLVAEELERRRDPASAYDLLAQIVAQQAPAAQVLVPEPAPVPVVVPEPVVTPEPEPVIGVPVEVEPASETAPEPTVETPDEAPGPEDGPSI